MEEGRKDDGGKLQWGLVPWEEMEDVVRVLMAGAMKYSPDNWKFVPDARRRYFEAGMRHMTAWWEGERLDPDTGLPHLAHAVCCLLFAAWHDKHGPVGPRLLPDLDAILAAQVNPAGCGCEECQTATIP